MTHIFRRSFLKGSLGLAVAPLAKASETGQPKPIKTLSVRHKAGHQWVTSIYRRWRKKDVARCRLCEKCSAHGDSCLISFASYIPFGKGAMASTVGHNVVNGGRPPHPQM